MRDYSYQDVAVQDSLKVIAGVDKPCLLWSSPTGTGKTTMQAQVLKSAPGGLQIIPTLDIGKGFARQFGIDPESPRLREELQERGIYTVKVLANILQRADTDFSWVRYLQIDEAHHSVDNTHTFVDSWFPGRPRLGWTATRFRGTAKETKKLWDWWGGNLREACTLAKAIQLGVYSLPEVTVWPLLDDDQLELSSGEFAISSVDAGMEEVMNDAVSRIVSSFWVASEGRWDRPTVIAANSISIAERLTDMINASFARADLITAQSSQKERAEIFNRLEKRETILVQVSVLDEGTDLPYLRRLIDLSPTMSPVRCMQRVGRVTRPINPGESPPEWVVCNHNLLRHAHLWKGLLPKSAIRSAVTSWGKDFRPSSRMCSRMVESLGGGFGRLTPAAIPTLSGDPWFLYAFGVSTGFETHQYCVIAAPGATTAVLATRVIPEGADAGKNYNDASPWVRIPSIPDIKGATSLPSKALTPGQQAYWKNAARIYGLDPDAKINNKQFAVLPILKSLNARIPK